MAYPVFEPLLPLAVWLSLAAGALVLLAVYGLDLARRIGRGRACSLVGLMGLAIALPLAILLNPTWHERLPPPEGKPQLTILLDASASMATADASSTADATGTTHRWDAARDAARDLAQRMSGECDVRLVTFAASGEAVDEAQLADRRPEGDLTDLSAALGQALAVERPQGQAIVLLSDGAHNAEGGESSVVEAAARAKVLASPIYTRIFGGDTRVRDLAVQVPTPQDLSFVGQQVPVRVQLAPHGLTGQVTQVSLTLDGREIDRREVVLADDRPQEIEFAVHHDQPGVYRYDVRATALTGESTAANNSRMYVLRVVDEPIRVLLLEGKPYWDTKFLLRNLAADGSLEIVSLTRLADNRFLERTLKHRRK